MTRFVTTLLCAVPRGRARFVLAVFLAAMATGSSIALMGVSAWLISRAAEYPPVMYLTAAAVGVRAFGIGRGAFRYAERLVGHKVALQVVGVLRSRTYAALARTTLIGRRLGDLLTRVVDDVAAIQDVVVRVALPALSASLVIVATTTILGTFNPLSAAVLFATAVLGGLVVPRVAQRMTMRADRAAVVTRGELADATRELAHVAQDLVANNAQAATLARALAIDDRLRAQEDRAAGVRGFATAAQILASGIAVVSALAIGGSAVATGDLKPRLLAVLVLTPLALHEVFQDFTKAAQTATRARAAVERVQQVLDADPVGTGDVLPGDGVRVELRDATIGWPGHPPVQEHLDLAVAPGEAVALVGPSGVGKTTVAATVMGLIPAQAGHVERAGCVGYLAQDAHIFASSVAENVRIGNKDATDDEVRDALARAGIDLPLDRLIGEDGSTLSGGERRRLALARVLVGERDLLILDEPTEHLDAETARALMRDVWAAAEGHPLLVITHDEQVMRACDRVVTLRPGGTPVA
ncbi:thiol reductant ABC exporter subunit CydC [uncultured Tessaracoccus sp.]|uniref:thiol reductant ABC exporter subunit CydC n=1 Tax=uncultured Tessaracoccus sp. TaxID=905023 RepID=UPI0025E5343E|nr:thiol reductant ABC exporter subunit CydC [uncultured Tessaracoccus sp.]